MSRTVQLVIGPVFEPYVETLLEHARVALWPERRAAIESFARGIAKCPTEALDAAVAELGVQPSEVVAPAELLFRAVLSVYLERLAEHEVTNPDQAWLYGLSLYTEHQDRAEAWLAAHPEYRPDTEV